MAEVGGQTDLYIPPLLGRVGFVKKLHLTSMLTQEFLNRTRCEMQVRDQQQCFRTIPAVSGMEIRSCRFYPQIPPRRDQF